MKLITYFALSLLISIPCYLYGEIHTLKSDILNAVDGIIIDGPTVALIKKYQLDSKHMLLGKLQPNGSRIGLYLYRNKNYSITELCQLEQEQGTDAELQKLLLQMRDDFERISGRFQNAVKNSKPVMVDLIIQSNHLRGRHNSLLNKWAHTSGTDDRILFDEHVHTIKDFEIFLIDIHNFLNDLVESCPKGQRLYVQWKNELLRKKSDTL
ncbi:MAG: hypothetical protein ACD_64C00214G0001 [uncultured bacterium]|jgi:hypothetical protein|nr:MAG: hypothetical protein ACD_64C00214G0001 [uncultured bacterium]HLE76665.1 hypothetical protein [Candidatus Babeliales bacterium]